MSPIVAPLAPSRRLPVAVAQEPPKSLMFPIYLASKLRINKQTHTHIDMSTDNRGHLKLAAREQYMIPRVWEYWMAGGRWTDDDWTFATCLMIGWSPVAVSIISQRLYPVASSSVISRYQGGRHGVASLCL